MTNIDIENLKAKAEAATHGWISPCSANAEGIIFVLSISPSTVLALIERVEKAEARQRRAPVQGFSAGIPWEMHLRAYDAYSKKWAPQKALIEGGCRGGFSVGELDCFIPGWREELSEVSRLRALLARAGEALKPFADEANNADAKHDATWFGRASDTFKYTWVVKLGDLRAARTVAAEIEKEIGND